MAVDIAKKIIRKSINDQIAFNIMNLKNPKEMWEKLKSVCTEVGQGVVYLILLELFHYPSNNKPKEYEKPVMQVFAKVKYLCKRLRSAITPGRDLWDTIAIVIAFDSLHQDFDTTTASLLETGDKSIDEIQSIFQSKEAKNLSKRATGDARDLAMAFRDKGSKRKANSNDECYNCQKFGHFGRDCFFPDRRQQNRNTQQSQREESWRGDSRRSRGETQSNTPNRAHQAAENRSAKYDDDSNPKPFTPGPVGTAFMVKKQRLQRTSRSSSFWFFDSCASRHLCNNRRLFTNTRAKSIDFITADGQVIQTEKIGTVSIPLTDGTTIELQNVTLALGCDSNLISLGQLRESGITYHNDPDSMTLMKNGSIIARAKRNHNLFTLDLAMPGQIMSAISRAMAITGRGRPTHLVSLNKHIRLWHWRLAYASNARVVRASKLVDGIDLGPEKKYNLAKVLIDSKESDANKIGDQPQSMTNLTQTHADPSSAIRQVKAETNKDNGNILDKLCTACVGSNSTRVVRRDKNITPITNKLEEVHADLWSPHNLPSQSKSFYTAILMCEHTRKTWTLYLQGKDDFVDAFQAWLPQVEAKSGCAMKMLRADGSGEFISTTLRLFRKKKGIGIKYAAPYVHEKNGLAEQGWRTFVTIKDSMLINSRLPNGFWAKVMETANYLWNRLPTRSKSHGEMIPEKSWTSHRQDLRHVCIFGSLALCNISDEKRLKSNYQNVQKGLLIGYSPDTIKHFRVWAPQTK